MKKILGIALLIGVTWVIYAYLASAMERERFIGEVDSLLALPRDISEINLPTLILNKTRETSILLDPEDIEITFADSTRETTTSRLVAKKGVATHIRVLTLRFHYAQPFLGRMRLYDYERERTFTAGIELSSPQASELEKAFTD